MVDMTKLFCCLLFLIPAAAQEPEVAAAVSFTEGPTVDREGNVYFSEIVNERIMKLDTNGVLSVYREHSNVANGLLIDQWTKAVVHLTGPKPKYSDLCKWC